MGLYRKKLSCLPHFLYFRSSPKGTGPPQALFSTIPLASLADPRQVMTEGGFQTSTGAVGCGCKPAGFGKLPAGGDALPLGTECCCRGGRVNKPVVATCGNPIFWLFCKSRRRLVGAREFSTLCRSDSPHLAAVGATFTLCCSALPPLSAFLLGVFKPNLHSPAETQTGGRMQKVVFSNNAKIDN